MSDVVLCLGYDNHPVSTNSIREQCHRTRDGKLIHGECFTHLMYGAKGVKEFQFVQETLDDYRLLVVTGPGYDPAQEGEWHRKIGEWVGMDARIEVGRVEAIPVLPSGKRKFTLSKLKS